MATEICAARLVDQVVLGIGGEAVRDDLDPTVLPVGMTSIVALPSGSVLTSRLPSSLPSFVGLKMTAAFMMGLPLNFFITVTSMWEVAGGALYLRPRLSWERPGRTPKEAQQAGDMRQTAERDRWNE